MDTTRIGAHAPGLAAPEAAHKDETPGVVAEGFEGDATENKADCAEAQTSAQAPAEDKALSTLRARLALRGIELKPLPSGEYMVRSRGAFTTLADLAAVESFARKAGAA